MPVRPFTNGKKAWELYLAKNVLDSRLVRAAVANSWERCRHLNVNPLQAINPGPDKSVGLDECLSRKQQLVRIARPFMRHLYQFVSGSPFQVILTDENGVLLEAVGEKAIASRRNEVHFAPGSSWSEAQKGTNAIGTALAEKKPVEIYAWEHFCEENQFLTCSAAPILDPMGNVIGCLDASGDYHGANPHTIGMVVATARAIESQLRLERANQQLYVTSHFSDVLIHGIADGVVAVDRNAVITNINARGGEILGVAPAAAKGKPLIECCSSDAPIMQLLSSGNGYQNRDIVDKGGRRIPSSASPLHDENGSVVGAIAFLRADRRTTKWPAVPPFEAPSLDDIVGRSSAIKAAKQWAELAAACNSTVLITGESGTGKELFAKAIHYGSGHGGPFIAVNCAALPESLIESELFGYEGGSFTGARKGGQHGKFELADGGTIFLDEIGDMSPNVQAKILRVLQDKRVSRIGSAQEVAVDIRIIAATHCDLKKEVEQGHFREDLYYRLAVLEVNVPPLRERMEDVPLLARCLADKITAKLNRSPVEIDASVVEKLAVCSWPGNIRAMENVIERSIIRMRDEQLLTVEFLELPNEAGAQVQAATAPISRSEPPCSIRPLREVEKEAIVAALSFCAGNIKEAASRLGIARNTLYRKMDEYELLPKEGRR